MRLTLGFHVFNKQDTIASVLQSWLDTLSGAHEVELIVVLDDTTDRSEEAVRWCLDAYPYPFRLLYARQGWEIGSNNLMLAAAAGDMLVCIQDDNWMHTPGWDRVLADTLRRVEKPGATAFLAGAQIDREGTLSRIECDRPHKGEYFRMQGCPNAARGVWRVPIITRPFAIGVDIARRVGGLDRSYWPMDFDDTDLSYRLHRDGYTNLYMPFDLMNGVGKRSTIQEARMMENYERGHRIFWARYGTAIEACGGLTAALLWPVNDQLEAV
jgi:glycosyltransferase involved in cell wall biosynthesis